MTQIALPISDVFTGGWTPTPVYAQINTPAPPDVTMVSSPVHPSPDSFEVKLSPLCWPGPGPQTLQIRLKQMTANLVNVTVVLLQGTGIIASWNVQPPTVFTTYSMTLTNAEVQSITDYTDLRVEVIAALGSSSSSGSTSPTGVGVQTTCCPNLIPTALFLTVTGGGIWNGNYLLGYVGSPTDPPVWTWAYDGTLGSCSPESDPNWLLQCRSDNGEWELYTGAAPPYYASSSSCSPFALVFTGVNLTACCGVTGATVTVTS